VLQGLGGGGLMTSSQALIGEAIPPRERARYQGYLAAVGISANAFGPVGGGYLAQHLGWQSIFLINLPLGLIAAALTLRLPAHTSHSGPWKVDGWGILLFSLFVAPVILALERAQHLDVAALGNGANLFQGARAALRIAPHANDAPSLRRQGLGGLKTDPGIRAGDHGDARLCVHDGAPMQRSISRHLNDYSGVL